MSMLRLMAMLDAEVEVEVIDIFLDLNSRHVPSTAQLLPQELFPLLDADKQTAFLRAIPG